MMAAVAAVAVVAVAFALAGNGGGGTDNEGKILGKVYTDHDLPQDSRLWVFGNADADDSIDENDTKYIEDVVAGKKTATVFCDANADGIVDSKDVAFVKKIIKKENMNVYYVDNYYTAAKVKWPVASIAIGYCSGAYVADVTGLAPKVKMVDTTINKYWAQMNSHYRSAVNFGDTETPNYETMLREKINVYVIGYCDENADKLSPSKLNPGGVDVMFMSTADNSGVSYPNEHIDRSILMFGFLLQGDMDKTYSYLQWHDNVLNKLKVAGKTIAEGQKAPFMMSRSSLFYEKPTVRITGLNNTNNLHAEWVGVHAVGQYNELTPKNYNKLTVEQIMTIVNKEAADKTLFYMDNAHDGMRKQYSLRDCIDADVQMLSPSGKRIHYLGMAREGGNSPMYVVELAFYQNIMYPQLSEQTGLDYKVLFHEYFTKFASENYYANLNIDGFFYDYTGSR